MLIGVFALDGSAHQNIHLITKRQEQLKCSLEQYPKLFAVALVSSIYLQCTLNYVL